ncbi:MAG TPA: hypothetical protein VN937_28335 [Blastocatellia bacterium]|nr:hypothetical protein [Blastocatellia bacterium]
MKDLRLTPKQRAAVSKLERDSFAEHCRRFNYSPAEHERSLLAQSKDELRVMLSIQNRGDKDLPQEVIEATRDYLGAPDYWTYKRLQNRDEVMDAATDIAAIAPSLPINWPYVHNVAREYGIALPVAQQPDSIVSFVTSIPHIVFFGNEFDAFVTRLKMLDDVPAVCMFEQLIASTTDFIDVVMMRVLVQKSESEVDIAEQERWDTIGKDAAFVENLGGAIDMILARRDWVSHPSNFLLSRSGPQMPLSASLMFMGAADFVRRHEYGHLLRGHLNQPQHPRIEFEADNFAMTVMASKELYGASFWYKAGAIAVIVMLMIGEAIDGPSPAGTHPHARDRLAALLSRDSDENLMLFGVAQAILGICRPTLASTYGIRQTVDDLMRVRPI